MERKAFALWKGSIQKGQGWISTLNTDVIQSIPYSFATRFEGREDGGTNPEELMAAAHASCFAMQLSGELTKKGFEVRTIKSSAAIIMDRINGQWTIIESRINVEADIPGIDVRTFQKLADDAKNNCPVSRVLNLKIKLNAQLKSPDTKETSLNG